MADSVDRVFAHALSTVRKIPRTGSARPPARDRLRLYGLYKQSMEGDVMGVMARPGGEENRELSQDELQLERAEIENWDAWADCAGLTRTDAKRRYIDTLISTMHTYASGTAEARDLVEELQFVWDQVKSNGNGSDGARVESQQSTPARQKKTSQVYDNSHDPPLRILRPMSDQDESEVSSDDPDNAQGRPEGRPSTSLQPPRTPSRSRSRPRVPGQPDNATWRSRVERALMQMTAEVAALREVVDSNGVHSLWRRSGGGRAGRGIGAWLQWFLWILWRAFVRLVVDAAVLGAIILIVRWRQKKRTELTRSGIGRALYETKEWIGVMFSVLISKMRRSKRETG